MTYYEVERYTGPKVIGSPTEAIAVTADSPQDAALLALGEVLSLSGSPAQARAKVSFVGIDGAARTVTLYGTLSSLPG